jgi:hypothetical protein
MLMPGSQPAWLRVPAVLPGVLSYVVLFMALRRGSANRTALLAALGVAVAPYLMTYSDLARGFMLADLALLVALWCLLSLADHVAARSLHPRTVLTNTPVVLYYLPSFHPVFGRPYNLGPARAGSCLRPWLIVDDTRRVHGGTPRQPIGADSMIGPFSAHQRALIVRELRLCPSEARAGG